MQLINVFFAVDCQRVNARVVVVLCIAGAVKTKKRRKSKRNKNISNYIVLESTKKKMCIKMATETKALDVVCEKGERVSEIHLLSRNIINSYLLCKIIQ